MRRVVLDSSALVTFFEERPGADKVEEFVELAVAGERELLISVINWGEVYYSFSQRKGADVARAILAEIAQLPIEIVVADYELTKLAAELKAQFKLHYTDCFAAALAQARSATVLTADKDFNLLRGRVPSIMV